jgi:hypothetical protein
MASSAASRHSLMLIDVVMVCPRDWFVMTSPTYEAQLVAVLNELTALEQ